jgi:hypothetical protein
MGKLPGGLLNLPGWTAHSCKDEEKGNKDGRCDVQCTEAQENRRGAHERGQRRQRLPAIRALPDELDLSMCEVT